MIFFKILFTIIILYTSSIILLSQNTLHLTKTECEERFIKENLLIIAEKLNIESAEAILIQSRLWPNPSINIEEVNLWASQNQSMGEELPPIFGNFGRNQQIGVEIEQLIITARKRKKLIDLEKINLTISKEYFEDFLRHLKIELRSYISELQYLQQYKQVYDKQSIIVANLLQAYNNQLKLKNIGKGEYIRLKAMLLEISKKINEINKEINYVQRELKLLMNIDYETTLIIELDDIIPNYKIVNNLKAPDLINSAILNRPDYKIALLKDDYYTQMAIYERAQRIPDLTIRGNYDRGGNFLYNFVGLGLSIDLPIFNRNQGNIRHALIGKEQSEILHEYKRKKIELEVIEAYNNLIASIIFFESIDANYEESLNTVIENYNTYFLNKNISLIEYLDFIEAYLENKKIILESKKELSQMFEELQYTLGTEIN